MSKKNAGFTLIDLILGIVIIAIAAVSSLEFYRYCHKFFILRSSITVRALGFAKESIEGLCWLDSSDASLNIPLPSLPALPATGDFAFTGSRSYSVIDKGSYKVLEVKVSW
ncbi:MAG: type II secretion system protein [Candidatus Omnitrophica bacterium]|nr:type II secretion system protein [Candidatus Omnitrophota bacterium]